MAIPGSLDARRFLRVATQRLDDARFLLGYRNTASIYLAGYAVECTLKALLLSVVPASKTPKILDSFRGERGHNLEWLKREYIRNGGAAFPAVISRKFARVNSWKTDIRYDPGTSLLSDAQEFSRPPRRSCCGVMKGCSVAQSKKSRPAGPAVRAILNDLETHYKSSHPEAVIESYRQNSASIRIRILDPAFQGMDRVSRDNQIWEILGKLPEDVQSQITVVLLLTPEEAKTSFANMDFENPIPSRL